ncbi:hypothetical protein OCL90_14520, partial [Enterococcus faecalis]|uniref:hypothetical protein n=1 Tax=Enterococcus faecalis TaxID=1351 RepID=UPI0022A6AEF7
THTVKSATLHSGNFKLQNNETTMITGDAKHTGEAVGRLVGVDQVFANVLPEEKSPIVDQ